MTSSCTASLPDVNLREWASRLVRVKGEGLRPAQEITEPRVIALRFRSECAEHGPYQIAAAINAPTLVCDIPDELRFISYLFAAAVAPDHVKELCTEQGIYGLQEWLDNNQPEGES